MDTEEDYKNLFESAGFKVVYCKIHEIRTKHSPEDMFKIFSSGAIAGYLNQDYYDVEIDEHYIEKFKEIVKKEFYRQSRDGVVELIFNRLFLIAVKE
jgi:trans-aconitate methyltransferase